MSDFSTPNSTKFGQIIEKVYRRLMSGQREQTVQLSASINDSVTTISVTGVQLGTIAVGAIIACELEVMLVTAFTATVGTASVDVIRGYNGSTASAHDADTLIYVNPKYTRYDIGVAINDDLMDLSSPTNGLFRVGVAKITYNPVFSGYDLGEAGVPKDFIDILDIRYRIAPPTHNFPPIKRWKVLRGIGGGVGSTTEDSIFPSGYGVVIYERGWPGLPLYVTYSAPFKTFTDSEQDLVDYSGFPATAVDLPALGAEIDLTIPREVKRNFIENQPDPRKAQDVPPQAISNSVAALILRREKRISSEADRLARQYTRVRGW